MYREEENPHPVVRLPRHHLSDHFLANSMTKKEDFFIPLHPEKMDKE